VKGNSTSAFYTRSNEKKELLLWQNEKERGSRI